MSGRCLILTSEFPPAVIGGVGRYVSEIAPRLNRSIPVRVALVPTYQPPAPPESQPPPQAVNADVERVHGQGFDCAVRHYRDALLGIDAECRFGALIEAARRVASECDAGVTAPGEGLAIYIQDYALAPIAAALRTRFPRARLVAACHLPVYAGFTYFDKPVSDAIHQILEAQLVRLAHRVVVPSAFAGHVLRIIHNLPESKIAVVPLGASRPVPPMPAPDGPLRVLVVGRPTEQKGYHFLFEAFGRLLRSNREARLTVVTGMTHSERLAELAARHGLAAHTDFARPLGHDSIWHEYDRHHLLVTASLYETFGLAVLEAMASRRPALGFSVGALPELWGRALDAELGTPVACVDGLVERLERVGGDAAYRAALAHRVERRAHEFPWERHVDRLAGLMALPGEAAPDPAASWR